jgi:hypothetical protein
MPAARATKPNPKDYTGNQKRILAEQHREEVAARQGSIAMRAQEAAENLDNPIDLTGAAIFVPESDDDVSDAPVQIEPDFATIRIACDLEKVTIGQGNVFEFQEGQVYRVPMNVARHLHQLGYVWQWL